MQKIPYNIVLTILILWLASITAATYFGKHLATQDESNHCNETPGLTNPELGCISSDRYEKLATLETTVQNYVDEHLKNKTSKRISVFFRDLDSKKWFGVRENALFAPGSLLKIPLAVAYLKYSEIDPETMTKNLVYNPPKDSDPNQRQHYPPPSNLQSGSEYKTSELLRRALVYSDNDAVYPLYENLSSQFYNKILLDLGIRVRDENGAGKDFISVKSQAGIFRALYNASYLNREQSEYILDLLSHSTFKKGIVQGVPPRVVVAHKFGESVEKDGDSIANIELHDCGIIYKENPPYILCVMTEGPDFESQEKVIGDISKLVYENL